MEGNVARNLRAVDPLGQTWKHRRVGAMRITLCTRGTRFHAGVLRPAPRERLNGGWPGSAGAYPRLRCPHRETCASTPICVDSVPGGVALRSRRHHDDLTYAISRLDEHSTDVALAYIASSTVTLTRRVVRCGMRCGMQNSIRAVHHGSFGRNGAARTRHSRPPASLSLEDSPPSFRKRSCIRCIDEVAATLMRLSTESEERGRPAQIPARLHRRVRARGGAQSSLTWRTRETPGLCLGARRALAARGLTDEARSNSGEPRTGRGKRTASVEARACFPRTRLASGRGTPSFPIRCPTTS